MSADLDREVGRAWEKFEGCDDSTRAHELFMLADLYETSAAEVGNVCADSDATLAVLLRLLADAEWVATGHLTYRHATTTKWEPVVGPLLDEMAGTADVYERQKLVDQIAAAVPDPGARDILANMPYAPADKSWSGMVRTLRYFWRVRRAA